MSSCTKCDKNLTINKKAQEESGVFPQQGDILICPDCGNVMVIEADLSLRDPSPTEQIQILGDHETMSDLVKQAMTNKRTLQ